MITLTLTAPSHQELRANMREFLGLDKEPGPQPSNFEQRVASMAKGPQMTRTEVVERAAEAVAKATPQQLADVFAPAEQEAGDAVQAEVGKAFVDQAQPAKRKRRTKAELEAAKASNGVTSHTPAPVSRAEEAPAPKQTTSVAAPIVSKEAAHQALQQVNVAVGLPKAREILTSFGAQRISDVKESDFAALIEKCNAAVMMA